MSKLYSVYIMTNFTHKVLFTGVTNNLMRRIYEYINKVVASGFTSKYNVNKLVYFESYDSPMDAI
ncbi:GIY-YIG nuclease family protein, partial [Candidatus Berkelbacteria bacterium]|nr:GIY-YIG nuclease family protein [Candidatus Berkelbacteria bacterium]